MYSNQNMNEWCQKASFANDECHPTESLPTRNSQYKWMELLELLSKNESLANVLLENINHLFVSKKRLLKQKQLSPTFKQLVEEFDPQNCLKAISVLKDLTHLKHNQFKFLFSQLTLGKAVGLLIRESFYLNRTLTSTNQPKTHFKRLITGWISFLLIIHKVPEEISNKMVQVIIENIELRLQNSIYPNIQPRKDLVTSNSSTEKPDHVTLMI